MSAPKETTQQLSHAFDLGMDNVSIPNRVAPFGEGGAFTQSINTRLSVTPGAPAKAPAVDPVTDGYIGGGAPCGGIVPAGRLNSSVAFFHPSVGTRRIAGDQVAKLHSTVDPAIPCNGYWPAEVSRAGVMPAGTAYYPPATVYDSVNKRTWFANNRADTSILDSAAYLSCIDDDGNLIIQPTRIIQYSGMANGIAFLGLTCHGANGVVLWYRQPGTNAILARTVSVTGMALSLGTPVTIYTPATAATGYQAVSSDSDGYAYLITHHSATATTASIHKVAIPSLSVATTNVASFSNATARLAINHIQLGTQEYLAIQASNAAGASIAVFDAATMTQLWTQSSINAPANRVTCGFWVGTVLGVQYQYAVFCSTDITGGVSGGVANPAGTTVQFRNLTTGTFVRDVVMPFIMPVAFVANQKLSAEEVYPLLVGQRHFSDIATPVDPEYVADPSIEVYRLDGPLGGVSPVGRFGVDTAAPFDFTTALAYSNAAWFSGSKLFVTYRDNTTKDVQVGEGHSIRYVEMDFASGQPRYAISPDGIALIAAAFPAQWDGVEVAEVSPIHAPQLFVQATTGGGGGPALTSGTYYFMALFSWKNAAGVRVRSAPSKKLQVVSSGTAKPILAVAKPVTFRDGARLEQIECFIYASSGASVADTTVCQQSYRITSQDSHFFYFANIDQPRITVENLPIYSDGDPTASLVAQCPGAWRDVEFIGKRAWAINAELPSEVWPSLERDNLQNNGVGYEFSSELRVQFPAAAGDVLAIVESAGNPVFLTQNGIYTVMGGPDNTLQGQPFGSPDQIASVRCTDRYSVVKTPAGIMFRSGNRFARFSGQLEIIHSIDADMIGPRVVATHVLQDYSEVLFVGPQLTYCYNYKMDRWSIWDTTVIPQTTCSALVPVTKDALLYDVESGQLSLMDTDSVSQTAQLSFETGDFLLGGPQDNNVLTEVRIQAERLGSHGLIVVAQTDYGTGPALMKSWTPAEIEAATINGRYTLVYQFARVPARTVKVGVAEYGAAGSAFKPLSATIVFNKAGLLLDEAVRASGRK